MYSVAYHDDCVKVMKTFPDKYFNLGLADPPYGLKQSGAMTGGKGKLRNRIFNNGCIDAWDKKPEPAFFEELFRVCENVIIFGGNYFDLPPTRCFVCWDKVQPWKNFSQCEYIWTSFTGPAKLIRIDNRKKGKIHPTQKPIELYKYLLETFAKPGDKIFDPMMGSQSSRIAAYMLGFDYTGLEIDADFYSSGNKRFEEYTNPKPIDDS